MTGWRIFKVFPPLLPIYALPVVYTNTGLIPAKSPAYDVMSDVTLPVLLVLLLVGVDVFRAVKVMGRGLLVMLMGTAGVVLGAPLALLVVGGLLGPDAWKGYGALAGSWTGGTGNMAAVADGLGTPGAEFGLAVIADNLVYVAWLPLLLSSRGLAGWFARFTRVPDGRAAALAEAAESAREEPRPATMPGLLVLIALALGATWAAGLAAGVLPVLEPVLTASTWKILLLTTFGVALSFTPARRIPGSQPLAMALLYVFVANMGAKTSLEGIGWQAVPFVGGAFLWITFHGLFVLLGAWLLRVDVHTAAIASAANIGGAASAPVVAAHHDKALVPMAILMAMVGYAVGTYAAFLSAWLCRATAPVWPRAPSRAARSGSSASKPSYSRIRSDAVRTPSSSSRARRSTGVASPGASSTGRRGRCRMRIAWSSRSNT